jgi:hypothetical protein
MVNIWLIRPGEGAFLWEECKENSCIVIGWENEDGFSKYNSLDDVKEDYEYNNANSIWSFYNEIEIGDVVVAIQGNNNVWGIGKIKSDYISPKDDNNPNLEYKNARLVDWVITEKLEKISHNLPQKTVTKEQNSERWNEIKTGYIKMNPEYEQIFDSLIPKGNIDLSGLIQRFVKEIEIDVELRDIRQEHNNRSKNVQEKLRKENIAELNQEDMLDILRKTDAANGIRFDLRDIFSKNNGFDKFKETLVEFLEETQVNENDINNIVKSIEQMGHGFLSELLCLKHPSDFWIWNSVTDDYFSKININIRANLPRGKKGDVGAQYLAMQPHLQQILNLLKRHGLNDATFLDVDMFAYWMKDKSVTFEPVTLDHPRIITQLYGMFSHTKNVILYGPPGTGKTYIAQQFVKDYLKDQISTPKTIEAIKIDLIRDLKWYQVIALTIYLKGKDQKVKVPELKNEDLIKDYFEIVKGRTKYLGQTLWAELGSHSTPNSKVVKYENRNQLALFDKTPDS